MTNDDTALTTRSLDDIAASIRTLYDASGKLAGEALTMRFAVGAALLEARQQFTSDKLFGQWVNGQEFPFSGEYRRLLMIASQLEAPMRLLLATSVAGREPAFADTVKALAPARDSDIEEATAITRETIEWAAAVGTPVMPRAVGILIRDGIHPGDPSTYPTKTAEDIAAAIAKDAPTPTSQLMASLSLLESDLGHVTWQELDEGQQALVRDYYDMFTDWIAQGSAAARVAT